MSDYSPVLHSVLVVDDDPICRSMIVYLLQRHGVACQVVAAADGIEALQRFEEHDYAVVITDNQMPRMGGLELAAVVKARWPETYVILVSGDLPIDQDHFAQQPDLDYCLAKPFPTQQLSNAVSSALSTMLQEQAVHSA